MTITENGYLEVPFSVTGLSSAVPGLDMTPIKIWNTRDGRPCLMCLISLDGVLFDTTRNFIEAVNYTTVYFNAFVEPPSLPAFSAIETGSVQLTSKTKSLFGIPDHVSEEEMWRVVNRFARTCEMNRPSSMFRGVEDFFTKARQIGIQPVVLTSNMTHGVACSLADEIGVLQVGVVRVLESHKTSALNFFAERQAGLYRDYYHRLDYQPERRRLPKPLPFFGGSVSDVDAAIILGDKQVLPFYVHRSTYDRRGLSGKFDWNTHLAEMLKKVVFPRRIVTHKGMSEELGWCF